MANGTGNASLKSFDYPKSTSSHIQVNSTSTHHPHFQFHINNRQHQLQPSNPTAKLFNFNSTLTFKLNNISTTSPLQLHSTSTTISLQLSPIQHLPSQRFRKSVVCVVVSFLCVSLWFCCRVLCFWSSVVCLLIINQNLKET